MQQWAPDPAEAHDFLKSSRSLAEEAAEDMLARKKANQERGHTVLAAEVSDAENVGAAALGVAVEEVAAGAVAAGGELGRHGGGGGGDDADEEGNDGELHFDGCFVKTKSFVLKGV